MAKLPKEYKFIDISDYGRPIARWIANSLVSTNVRPVDVTTSFIVCGLFGIWAMLCGYFWIAGILLTFKSILDAADGELARIKNTPSYTGRYYDSVADIVLNFLIILALWQMTNCHVAVAAAAFVGMQLQGTLYNYYYVILRNKVNGDTTSRVFESEAPTALPGESQQRVNMLFKMYNFLYKGFDKAIYSLDKNAVRAATFPRWFMTLVSTMGLGSHLLLISILLVIGKIDLIIPTLAIYTFMIFIFVGIRQRF